MIVFFIEIKCLNSALRLGGIHFPDEPVVEPDGNKKRSYPPVGPEFAPVPPPEESRYAPIQGDAAPPDKPESSKPSRYCFCVWPRALSRAERVELTVSCHADDDGPDSKRHADEGFWMIQ